MNGRPEEGSKMAHLLLGFALTINFFLSMFALACSIIGGLWIVVPFCIFCAIATACAWVAVYELLA